MVRPQEAKVLKAMKEAKTAAEMTKSWFTQRPGYEGSPGAGFDFYIKRKPEMVSTYAHNQLTQMVERGILDPKTRYLVILACYMMANHWDGLLPQCCNAKAAGATDEEIMEVAFLACYAVGKAKNADTSQALGKVLESPVFKNVKKLTDNP
jgi:alkylhydroperoxidase/carboxymuconolactone decarboxylase family protein YurZ